MLMMSIATWEPNRRAEMIKRALERGLEAPEGIKVLHWWNESAGGRSVMVAEVDSVRSIGLFALAWNDLCKIETFPIMDVEEVLEVLKSQ